MKKTLALFLALVMCLSLICVPAFAETATIDTVSFASISGLTAGSKVSEITATFEEDDFNFKDALVFDLTAMNPLDDNDVLVAGTKYDIQIILEAHADCAFASTTGTGGLNYDPNFTLNGLDDYVFIYSMVASYYDDVTTAMNQEGATEDTLIYANIEFEFTATEDTGSNVIDEVSFALIGFEAGAKAAFPDILIQPVDDYYNDESYTPTEMHIDDITGVEPVIMKETDTFEKGHSYRITIGLTSYLPYEFDTNLKVNLVDAAPEGYAGLPKGSKVNILKIETSDVDANKTDVENNELVNAVFEITFTLSEPESLCDKLMGSFNDIVKLITARVFWEKFKPAAVIIAIVRSLEFLFK